MSHMCFGESLSFSAMLSTHPPLEKRIEVIFSGFAARRAAEDLAKPEAPAESPAKPLERGEDEDGIMGLAHAARLRAGIPASLREAAHREVRVRGVIYALLLAQTRDGERAAALDLVSDTEGELVVGDAVALIDEVEAAGVQDSLPLVEIALPSLKAMGAVDRIRLLATAQKVVNSDQRFTLFEFVLLTLRRQRLERDHAEADAVKYTKFEQVIGEVRLLMSVLARAGTATLSRANKLSRG